MGCTLLKNEIKDFYNPLYITRHHVYRKDIKFYISNTNRVVHILKGHHDAHIEINRQTALKFNICYKCDSTYNQFTILKHL
jgi:hypothetical protein